jgi:hypothetical protein
MTSQGIGSGWPPNAGLDGGTVGMTAPNPDVVERFKFPMDTDPCRASIRYLILTLSVRPSVAVSRDSMDASLDMCDLLFGREVL